MQRLTTQLSIILLLFMGNACKKDKLDFKGQDNFISAFSLKKNGTVFTATITDSLITIKAPDNFSLDSAQVNVSLSENATIYPNPANMMEWDEEAQFVVTAYNGDQKTFRYKVVRTSIDVAGTVVLATQADVEALGKTGATEIGGNLIIGSTTGKDSIYNLAPLYRLKKIGYSLIIYPSYAAREIVGLDALESVGDAVRVESADSVQSFRLPALTTAGSISIKSVALQIIELPKLSSVTKFITVDGNLAGVAFPNLTRTGGAITFSTESTSGAVMSSLSFPVLQESGGLAVTFYQALEKIEMPSLTKTGDLNFTFLGALRLVSCPRLQTSGNITLPETSRLSEISFPLLTQAGGLTAGSKSITVLDLPQLQTVSGDLSLTALSIDGIKSLSALTTVGGTLTLRELTKMTGLDLPSSLQKIGKLLLYFRSVPTPAQINIKGLDIGELDLEVAGATTLIGDDIFSGILTVSPSGLNTFPSLQGFKQVDSVSFAGYISAMNDVQIKGIHKINRGFQIPNNNVLTFSMPDLEEVGGDLVINQLAQLTQATVEFPALKKVSGMVNILIESPKVSTLRLPVLSSIGGSCLLGTGFDDRCLANIQLPLLETIGGELKIYAEYFPSYVNNKLTNLDGFSKLKQVQHIEVSGQSLLASFAGLQNAFPALTADSWLATDNLYNPSYADLKAGHWVKP